MVSLNVAQHNPCAITATYLGPEADLSDTRRSGKSIPYASGKTASYVPTYWLYKRLLDNRDLPYTKKPVEDIMRHPLVSPIDFQDEDHREAIRDSAEAKIAHFFRKSCFLYKTGIQCAFYDAADAQIGGPSTTNGRLPFWERVKNGQFEAAHTATLPALRVGFYGQNKIFALGRGSSFQDISNETTWFPAEVNKFHTLFERHTRTGFEKKSLRFHSITFLNSVALNRYDPRIALDWYLYTGLEHLDCVLNRQPPPEVRLVAEDYKSVFLSYRRLNESNFLVQSLSTELRLDGESLFMTVQQRMHYIFITEMQNLMPVVYDTSLLEARLLTVWNPSRFYPYLSDFLLSKYYKATFTHSKTVNDYVNLAVKVRNVRIAALGYMMKVWDEDQLGYDLSLIESIKTKKSINQPNLSLAIIALCHEILVAISGNTDNPKKLGMITITVLRNLSYDPRIDT